MSHFLVLLVLFVTILLSSLPSPASGQPRPPSARLIGGSNEETEITPVSGIPPGGVFEISTSFLDDNTISRLCFREDPDLCFTGPGDDFRSDYRLKSTNPDVASVIKECGSSDAELCIILNKPGSTILKLLQNDEPLAFYVLIVTPSLPGTRCQTGPDDVDVTGIVDCSGTCVSHKAVSQRLGDGICDDGKKFDDGSRDIDLSCVFVPEFFLTDLLIRPWTHRTDRDGGDCSPEESCIAQFEKAPEFKLCGATASFCRFNAATGFNTPTGRGTCADMCQQFGSRCVAALDNDSPGCTPSPNSRDTCQTRRETEICVCERR